MSHPKKLIEVALPLEAINKESAREKSIRHGHPSTLHLWWARRPLAACRAVLFAQMVDDPGSHPELFPTEEAQEAERQRLFRLIEELVKWENINDRALLDQAHAEICKYAPDGTPPPVLDPFAGGGSIPLEAQRLGLEAHASDLNPVAVLINKALIEIPPRFAGQAPVNPESRGEGTRRTVTQSWQGAAGLAEDVRRYGQWMRAEAEKRIGHLYPTVAAVQERDGAWRHATPAETEGQGARVQQLTVIAWLWARTVVCPNPACGARMPLVRSFDLSTKTGKRAWVEPVVDRTVQPPRVAFTVRTGKGTPQEPPKVGRGAKFRCLVCANVAEDQHIKDEGMAGRMGAQLMAIVAEGERQRIYLPPVRDHEEVAAQAIPTWAPDAELPDNPRWFSPPGYGMKTYATLFTDRQLVALTTFSDLVGEARARVQADALAAGLSAERAGGYADGVATYLGFGVSKGANLWSTICSWMNDRGAMRETFARQAIPMVWDYAEANPFSDSGGNLSQFLSRIADSIEYVPGFVEGIVTQQSAMDSHVMNPRVVVSTDPPYYDNIGYADLSDYFYVWLRRSLSEVHPSVFGTLLVPKAQELVATPYRFNGGKEEAQSFFEQGLLETFRRMYEIANINYPLTVYYAFKQSETSGDGTASTGWETMLEGLVRTGFQVTGTWPVRTESPGRAVALGTNALASSIVLVCRVRPEGAPLATRRDFLSALQRELPAALRDLQRGNIAPVDLAQAAIGPGMAIYSRYRRVIEADGSAMRVRTALTLINQALDEYLSEQEGEFDADTRWALAWFEQFAFEEAEYGVAETLSKAKNTSVSGMVEAGILHARAGKVRLLRRDQLAADWDPAADRRATVWEATQHLIRVLEGQGEVAAAALLARLGPLAAPARDLAYRLYTLCERKGWAAEALPYNALVVAWSDVGRMAGEKKAEGPVQGRLEL